MPALADLQTRYSVAPKSTQQAAGQEEMLVADARSKLSPAQMVDLKLRSALLGATPARIESVTAAGQRRAPR